MVRNFPANAGDLGDTGSIPGLGRYPGGGNANPLRFLPRESLGQMSLDGYSPWGHKELVMAKHLSMQDCTSSVAK